MSGKMLFKQRKERSKWLTCRLSANIPPFDRLDERFSLFLFACQFNEALLYLQALFKQGMSEFFLVNQDEQALTDNKN